MREATREQRRLVPRRRTVANRERAANAIKTRRDGKFRRYALYAQVADELYPLEAFAPAQRLLDKAKAAAGDDPESEFARRVAFVQVGLDHARLCVETARVMNDPQAGADARAAAVARLVAFRHSIAATNITNLDKLSVIELESWKDVPGFAAEQ